MSLQRTLWSGLLAGILSGLLLGILQVGVVTPLINKAEEYEHKVEESHSEHEVEESHNHDHGEGWEMAALTVGGTTALGIAFGLLSVLLLRILPQDGFRREWMYGLLFGCCGFLAVHGIPAIGLPPPPPGVVGAENDLKSRQMWWLLTVGASILAFLVLAFIPRFLNANRATKPWLVWITVSSIALGLFILPFLVGLPEHSTITTAPDWLRHKFVLFSLGTNAVFWLVLGTLLTLLLARSQGIGKNA